jgi:hypothetical protein
MNPIIQVTMFLIPCHLLLIHKEGRTSIRPSILFTIYYSLFFDHGQSVASQSLVSAIAHA